VAAGRDPAKDRCDKRRAANEAATVRAIAEQWLTEHVDAKRKPRTAANYRWLLDHVVLPAVGTKKIAELARADVAKLHYAHRATPYAANGGIKVLRTLCNWAEEHGFRPRRQQPGAAHRKVQRASARAVPEPAGAAAAGPRAGSGRTMRRDEALGGRRRSPAHLHRRSPK
jgi:hypothetical protein